MRFILKINSLHQTKNTMNSNPVFLSTTIQYILTFYGVVVFNDRFISNHLIELKLQVIIHLIHRPKGKKVSPG